MRRALPLLLTIALASCADAGEPQSSAVDPCLSSQAALLGCPAAPPAAAPTIEDACLKLVDCGIIPLNFVNADGSHNNDYTRCLNVLHSDEYDEARLHFTLHCVEVSTCQDLVGSPDQSACFVFGGNP